MVGPAKVAQSLVKAAGAALKAAAELAARVPPVTFNLLVKVLVPVSRRVPEPILVIRPAPLTTPETVTVWPASMLKVPAPVIVTLRAAVNVPVERSLPSLLKVSVPAAPPRLASAATWMAPAVILVPPV